MANQTPALICGTGKWPFGTIFWQIPRMYGLRQAKQDQGQEVPAPALEQETTTHLPSIPRPRASRTPTSDHKGQEGEGDALSLPPGRSPNQSKAGARGRGGLLEPRPRPLVREKLPSPGCPLLGRAPRAEAAAGPAAHAPHAAPTPRAHPGSSRHRGLRPRAATGSGRTGLTPSLSERALRFSVTTPPPPPPSTGAPVAGGQDGLAEPPLQ